MFAEARTDRVVVLENLGDASNVGAIFRNALALDAGAVLPSPGTTDPLYRKVVRVSAGAAVALPFARLHGWPRDLKRVRDAGYTLVALTPREDAVAIATLGRDRPLPTRLELLLGTEGRGLSLGALAAANLHARIPMAPAMDSLNVARPGRQRSRCSGHARRVSASLSILAAAGSGSP